MADQETEAEWEKSRRIEAERMKAERAMEEDKSAQINSALLDMKPTNVKGLEQGTERKLRSIERAGDFSVGIAVLGVVVRFVIMNIPLPLGILVKVIMLIGLLMLGVSVIFAVVSLVYAFYYKDKTKFNFKGVVVTASAALAIVVIYVAMNFALIMSEIMI